MERVRKGVIDHILPPLKKFEGQKESFREWVCSCSALFLFNPSPSETNTTLQFLQFP